MKLLFSIFTALVGLTFLIGSIWLSIVGLIASFSASILLGIVVLLIEPLPLILGLAKTFWHVDVAAGFINYLTLYNIHLY